MGPAVQYWTRIACVIGFCGVPLLPARATPQVPAGDAVVLEVLPQRFDPELAAIAGLRAEVQRSPADPRAALQLRQLQSHVCETCDLGF